MTTGLFRKILNHSIWPTRGLCTNKNFKYNFSIEYYSTNSQSLSTSNEYTEEPQYPPIDDLHFTEVHQLKEKKWRLKIQNLPTVEQKLMELNMPKYYGYKTYILDDKRPHTNGNDFIKFVTRTHVVEGLPKEYYSDVKVDHLLEKLKPKIEELIYLHHNAKMLRVEKGIRSPVPEFNGFNTNFNLDLNNLLLKVVQEDGTIFSPNSVDIEPRLEGFWFAGGFEIPKHYKDIIEKRPNMIKHLPEHREMCIRSTCSPTIGVRTKLGLPEVVSMDDHLATNGEIPLTENGPQNPQNYGIHYRFRRACIIPGFWPGVEDEHSQLFIYPRIEIFRVFLYNEKKTYFNPILQENKAIVAGFTQALSYALYQGFTPVNEVTYPFTNQSVMCDGKNFQFILYQMNTCCLHSDRTLKNARNNIMWKSEDMPLFESLEGENVKGLNEDVLKMLLSMYLKKGVQRTDPNPYLADYKFLMNHDAPTEYKDLFQTKLIKLMKEESTIHKRPYMATWEKIYKVLFKTRTRDPARKWFETDKADNPNKRRLDDYQVEYIPRYNRINPRIRVFPRLNSEHLFAHDYKNLRPTAFIYPDDKIAFQTLNVLPNSDRYRSGKSNRKWRKSKEMIHTVDPKLL